MMRFCRKDAFHTALHLYMNIGYIIIGLFFLLNPMINIIDVLPDFIGYALIVRGLMKYSSICENFKVAYSQFKLLLILSIAKVPCLAVHFIMGAADNVWGLLFTVCFGIFEILFGIRAFAQLFDGLSYCAMRSDTTVSDDFYADLNLPEKKLSTGVFNHFDFISKFTIFFVIFKVVMSVLPELVLLDSGEFGTVTPDGIRSISDYYIFFVIFAFALTLVVGIYWFVRIREYFRGVAKDKEYLIALEDKYAATLKQDTYLPIHRQIFASIAFFIAGFIFLISIPFDGINYIPRAIGAILLGVAALMLRKIYNKEYKKAFRFTMIYSGVSIVTWICQLTLMLSIFKSILIDSEGPLSSPFEYVLDRYLRTDFNVLYSYIGITVLIFVESACMVLLLIAIKKLISNLIEEHTGVLSLRGDSEGESAESKILRESLQKHLKVTFILGIITEAVAAIQYATCTLFPPLLYFYFILRIAYIVVAVVLLIRIKEAVKSKYYIV